MSASQEWAKRVADPDDPATNSDDPRFNPSPPEKLDGTPRATTPSCPGSGRSPSPSTP